jgi:hypothetical protein
LRRAHDDSKQYNEVSFKSLDEPDLQQILWWVQWSSEHDESEREEQVATNGGCRSRGAWRSLKNQMIENTLCLCISSNTCCDEETYDGVDENSMSCLVSRNIRSSFDVREQSKLEARPAKSLPYFSYGSTWIGGKDFCIESSCFFVAAIVGATAAWLHQWLQYRPLR